jgi:hypothetical protein
MEVDLRELLRSNDIVMLGLLVSLLHEAGIGHVVLDAHMSVMEGSLGVLPRRLMVEDERFEEARTILREVRLRAGESDGDDD